MVDLSAGTAGFTHQGSFAGDCKYTPEGSTCLRFEDGYLWLVYDGGSKQVRFGIYQGKPNLGRVWFGLCPGRRF